MKYSVKELISNIDLENARNVIIFNILPFDKEIQSDYSITTLLTGTARIEFDKYISNLRAEANTQVLWKMFLNKMKEIMK